MQKEQDDEKMRVKRRERRGMHNMQKMKKRMMMNLGSYSLVLVGKKIGMKTKVVREVEGQYGQDYLPPWAGHGTVRMCPVSTT